MSKYSRLPKPKEQKENIAKSPKIPISPLCCLPILKDSSPSLNNQLQSFLSYEQIFPTFIRTQICQMMYMDELLSQLKEYRPTINDSPPKNPIDFLTEMDKSGTMNTVSKIMKYRKTQDPSSLLEIVAPNNPMLSALIPMLSGGGDMSGMMNAFMPMMGDLSSMFKM